MTMAKILYTGLMSRKLFENDADDSVECGESRGTAQETIEAIPLIECTPEVQNSGPETSCAVCLGDFETGETLRQLPCGHKFHQCCIDTWLCRSKVCPLCIQSV